MLQKTEKTFSLQAKHKILLAHFDSLLLQVMFGAMKFRLTNANSIGGA